MAYDEAGNPGPDGIGMYPDRATALDVGRQRDATTHASIAAAYERASTEPMGLSGLGMLGLLGIVIVGNAFATAFGLSFDNAVWLMIGMLVAVAVVAKLLVKRREAREVARKRQAAVQAVGFSTQAAYDRAALARQTRLGNELYLQLVNEAFEVSQRTTGASERDSLLEFETALAWCARQHGVDGSLSGQDFQAPRPSLRRTLAERLRGARFRLLTKTTGVFAILSVGAGSLLVAAGLVETKVGLMLTLPLWGAWGAVGATLALVHEVASLVLTGLDEVVFLVQRTAASTIHATALRLSGTPTGIRVAALPEVFKKWRSEILGDVTEGGPLGRMAGWIGGWLLEGVQNRALRQVSRDARQLGAAEVSLVNLSNALPAIATSALTGPLRRSIAFTRWFSGVGMFCGVLLTALSLFGASLLKR